MITKVVSVNEFDVADQPVEFICYGLGSCIGLFVSDITNTYAGAAHIPLPRNGKTGSRLKGASNMIEQMMLRFELFGVPSSRCIAKIAGGAKVVTGTQQIGQRNIQIVQEELTQRGIQIAAADVGGSVYRTVRYNSLTGDLIISTQQLRKYSI